MPADRRRGELRGALLLPLAAWVLHQLRYELWFGAGAHRALLARGHAYMAGLEPLVVGFAAALAGVVIARLARAWLTGAPRSRRAGGVASLTRVALTAAVALLLVFTLQETLEGALAAGHPAGGAALFAGGGWIALPLALLLGGVVALLVRGGEIAARLAARAGAAHQRRRRSPVTLAARRPRPRAERPRVPVLAGSAAGRAPPPRPLPHPTG